MRAHPPGCPLGRVWSLGAAPTLGPPGSWRGGRTAAGPDRAGPLSLQRPASTAPSSSPRACPCPRRPAPGEANPHRRVSRSPRPLPRAREVSVKACVSGPSLRQSPVPVSLFSPGEGAEILSRSARGGRPSREQPRTRVSEVAAPWVVGHWEHAGSELWGPQLAGTQQRRGAFHTGLVTPFLPSFFLRYFIHLLFFHCFLCKPRLIVYGIGYSLNE